MAMVDVRAMRMRMNYRSMFVQVDMRFPGWIVRPMTVLMVLVMRMLVGVNKRPVNMKMSMFFGRQQPDTPYHSE